MTESEKITSECLGAFDAGLSDTKAGYRAGAADFKQAVALGSLKSTSTTIDLDRARVTYGDRILMANRAYANGYDSAFLTSALNSVVPPSAIRSDARAGYAVGLADFKQAVASGDLRPDTMTASDLEYALSKYGDRALSGKGEAYASGYKGGFLASALSASAAAAGWNERLTDSFLDVLQRRYGPLPGYLWGLIGVGGSYDIFVV